MSEDKKYDEPFVQPRLWQAQSIKESAARLLTFIECEAPEFIIEQARQLLVKKVIDFPVDSKNQIAVQNLFLKMRHEDEVFLRKNGYFNKKEKS